MAHEGYTYRVIISPSLTAPFERLRVASWLGKAQAAQSAVAWLNQIKTSGARAQVWRNKPEVLIYDLRFGPKEVELLYYLLAPPTPWKPAPHNSRWYWYKRE